MNYWTHQTTKLLVKVTNILQVYLVLIEDVFRLNLFEKSLRNISGNFINSLKNSNIFNSKKDLRSEFLSKRSELTWDFVDNKSSEISDILFSQDYFLKSSNIGIYFPVNNEVDTNSIFSKCVELNKKVFYPKVTGNDLVFYNVRKLNDLSPCYHDIPEPSNQESKINKDGLDLILVPGLCFDRSGNRLGYGKGFYDRFLKDLTRTMIVGLAFEFQVLDNIPFSEEDIKVENIITESGVIDCLGRWR
ncbi:MAG: 5-formyltetrahydrofolate cyclo-ligase [Candidatus Dadabacteria bacterium]|nr:5-formyltetrahydrofolate cyclo-ligase [Candidatus Dadabacteria bacterium]NIQ16784.1 5-formyltetrahydrofolate cyclo-ligase [Candidatus Dadabacteria bacterium]